MDWIISHQMNQGLTESILALRYLFVFVHLGTWNGSSYMFLNFDIIRRWINVSLKFFICSSTITAVPENPTLSSDFHRHTHTCRQDIYVQKNIKNYKFIKVSSLVRCFEIWANKVSRKETLPEKSLDLAWRKQEWSHIVGYQRAGDMR